MDPPHPTTLSEVQSRTLGSRPEWRHFLSVRCLLACVYISLLDTNMGIFRREKPTENALEDIDRGGDNLPQVEEPPVPEEPMEVDETRADASEYDDDGEEDPNQWCRHCWQVIWYMLTCPCVLLYSLCFGCMDDCRHRQDPTRNEPPNKDWN